MIAKTLGSLEFIWAFGVAFQSSQRITDGSCFSLQRVSSGDWTRVIRLGDKVLYSWSHLCGLPFSGFLSQTWSVLSDKFLRHFWGVKLNIWTVLAGVHDRLEYLKWEWDGLRQVMWSPLLWLCPTLHLKSSHGQTPTTWNVLSWPVGSFLYYW